MVLIPALLLDTLYLEIFLVASSIIAHIVIFFVVFNVPHNLHPAYSRYGEGGVRFRGRNMIEFTNIMAENTITYFVGTAITVNRRNTAGGRGDSRVRCVAVNSIIVSAKCE